MSDDASPAPAQPGCKGKGSERLVVNFESEPDCRLWRTRSSLGKKLHHDANSSKCTFGGSLVVNGYFALASWEVPPGLKRGKSQPLFGAHGLVLKAKADGRALQYNVTVRTGKMINNRLEGGFEVCVVFSHQSPHAHRARMLPEPPCLFSAPHLLPSVAIVFSVFFFSVCFFSTLASCVFSPRTLLIRIVSITSSPTQYERSIAVVASRAEEYLLPFSSFEPRIPRLIGAEFASEGPAAPVAVLPPPPPPPWHLRKPASTPSSSAGSSVASSMASSVASPVPSVPSAVAFTPLKGEDIRIIGLQIGAYRADPSKTSDKRLVLAADVDTTLANTEWPAYKWLRNAQYPPP